jgi:hypothetical protein
MAVFSMTFTGLMPYAALGLSALADTFGFARVMQMSVVLYVITAGYVLLRMPAPGAALAAADAAAALAPER